MLRLEKLNISGFKSFSDRTEVRFPPGITAVVGPNGCGKSNIGDAINWVLGEQSPKMLRGRQMIDVIFNGSAARKPQGLAEVSLSFTGAEGLPHSDHGRIDLTRRLYRSGDSEYLLNGSKARLMDIQELLREARIGTKTYSKIEQGRIDQVLNAKPKERRLMIEDAAGVAGYKHKRRLTEMKLEATEANLLRVNDIVTEVTRQINTVKRQASKARRYKTLREELREQDQIRFAARAVRIRENLASLRLAESTARDAEIAAAAGLSKLEVDLIDRRAELEASQLKFREAAEELHKLELEIDREEAQIRAHKERAQESTAAAAATAADRERLAERSESSTKAASEQLLQVEESRAERERLQQALEAEQQAMQAAESRLSDRRRELEDGRKQQFESMQRATELRNRLRSTEEMLEREAQQRARLEAEQLVARDDWSRLEDQAQRFAEATRDVERRLELLEHDFRARETGLEEAKGRLRGLVEQLSEAREHRQSAQSQLATLEDLATRFAGVSDGVRSVLSKGMSQGIRSQGVVADFVEAGAQVERAAEGYLNALLPAVILEDDGDVTRAASMLRAEGAGRTSFLSKTQPVGGFAVGTRSNGSGGLPQDLLDDKRTRGRLSDNIKLNTALNGALKDRIGDAVLVDSLQSALDLHRQHPHVDFLTEEGDVVHASGVIVVGGGREGDRGLLAHNRKILEVRAAVLGAGIRVDALSVERDSAVLRVEELEKSVREGRQELEGLRARQLELRIQAEQSQEQQQRSGRRKNVLDDELAALAEQAARLKQELETATEEVAAAERQHEQSAVSLQEHQAATESEEAAWREQSEKVHQLRAGLAAKEEQIQAREQENIRLNEALKELQARIDALETQRTAALQRVEESNRILATTNESLVSHLESRDRHRAANEETERRIGELQRDLSKHEDRLRGDRGSLDGLREATRLTELETTRADSDRVHLEELCSQELGIGPDEAIEAVGSAIENVDLEELETRVATIKSKIENLGPVNMTAIEEFSELEERHTFLTSQREDLQQSMASLRETIRRINRQSREKFIEAFEQIRASYQEIYKILFNGGRADLRLEEGEDVLECGIEILAQPPGKRLAGVHLLSGGEKALSAIALLFAIFRYSPSPFCMLDEVDAALDESNVGRFSRMLREYSQNTQFIMVTHNKVSMEQADLLYGVTMEEPGVSKLISMRLAD